MDGILKELNKIKINLSGKYSLLDPSLSVQGKYSSKWKLRINTNVDGLEGF
jgi:predicted transcriptional regulator of viral defense system